MTSMAYLLKWRRITKTYTKRNLAMDIVDLFNELLSEKDIEVPCSNTDEESERHADNNCACLYGMEYWNLVDRVEWTLIMRKELL